MSLLILGVLGAVGAAIEETIEDAIGRRRERARWARRRARRYTFN